MGFDNAGEFCDGLPSEIKIIKGNENCFFKAVSYILAGTEEMCAYTRLKTSEFMRSNGAHIQNAQAYCKQSHMEKNSVWAMENEILAAAKLFDRYIVIYSFYESSYKSLMKWLHYITSENLDQPLN